MSEVGPPQPIPMTIIGGFLGSGKTTLLNHLLTNADGRRFAVIVNDFGSINIYARLVVSVEGETIALTNGCICCVIRGDLIEAVLKLCASDDPPEHIVIETSGVAKPLSVVESFFRPEVRQHVDVQSLVTLLDADQAIGEASTYADIAYAQIALADIVVVNKIDLVDHDKLIELRRTVERIVPQARIWQTSFGVVPNDILFDHETSAAAAAAGLSFAAGQVKMRGLDRLGTTSEDLGHAARFASWSYRDEERRFSLGAVQRIVEGLPRGVYRAKGVVRLNLPTDDYGVLQVAGRRGRLKLARRPNGGPASETLTEIIFIGEPDATSEEELTRLIEQAWRTANDPAAPAHTVKDLRAFNVDFI